MDRGWASKTASANTGSRRKASTWLKRIQKAPITLTPGLGQGRDIDFEGGGLHGSGLWHEGQVVHLAVFAG